MRAGSRGSACRRGTRGGLRRRWEDEPPDPAADQAYVRAFCSAFSEFIQDIAQEARAPAEALREFAQRLQRTQPPQGFEEAHRGYLELVRAAVTDPQKLTAVGEVPQASAETEARLKAVAAGVPECRELGIFQR
ncbi:MAG: hypothetical protein ACR2HN_05620 [Tepidiformaceae bacterium]